MAIYNYVQIDFEGNHYSLLSVYQVITHTYFAILGQCESYSVYSPGRAMAQNSRAEKVLRDYISQ